MAGDTAASNESNGKVTLAVIGTKLDTLIASVEKLSECVRVDHDELITLKEQMKDFLALKRAALGYGIMLIISLALALTAIVRASASIP